MQKKNLIYLIMLFGILSCGKIPDTLIMPEWDTDLNLPLTNREYIMKDLIKDQSYIKYDTTNGKVLYRFESDTIRRLTSLEEFILDQLNTNETKINVPLQNAQGTGYLDFTNGAMIDSAFIKEGIVFINIANGGTANMNYNLSIPGLYDKSNKQYAVSGTVSAGSNLTKEISLSGFTFSNSSQIDKNKVAVIANVSGTSPTGNATIKLRIYNSKLKYISGVLPTKYLQKLNRSIELPVKNEILRFKEKVKLNDATLMIKADYVSNHNQAFEVIIKNLRVTGFHLDGTQMSLTQNGSSNLGDVLVTNGKLFKEFTSTNSNISDIISFLPDSLALYGDILVNPDKKYGIATDIDSISVKALLHATSNFGFQNLNFSDTLNFETTESNRNQIRDAKYVKLINEITNSLAMESFVTFSFTDKNLIPYFTKKLTVKGAEAIGTNGETVPAYFKSEIELDSAEIASLSVSERILISVDAKPTDINMPVVLTPDSWLKILSYIELNYHLKPSGSK